MNIRLIFSIVLFFLLQSNENNAQYKPFIYKDRLGDSIVLKDISEKPIKTKSPKLLTSEFALGPMLLTDGYGVQFTYGKYFGLEEFGSKDFDIFYNTHVIQLTLSERFHPKEYRDLLNNSIRGVLDENQSGIPVYGKINNFYNINLSYGQRRLFGGKGEPKAALVQFYFGAGINVALIKPYYIETSAGMIKYSDTLQDYFLDQNQIYSKGGLSYGWNELTTQIGLSLKTGIHWDFAKRRNRTSAIELGVGVDYYLNKIQTMVLHDPKAAFANIYFTYQIGKRR